MYNPLLETIFTAYEKNFSLEPGYTIEFFEANNSSFAEVDELDSEYLAKYTMMSAKYIAALVEQKRYQRAISQSKEVLAIIDENEARLKIKHLANSPYNGIIYHRAMAKYRNYIFKSAMRDFYYLLKNEPLNNNIKRWYIASKYQYYIYLCLGITLCIFPLAGIMKRYMSGVFAAGILIIGFSCCLASAILIVVRVIKLKNIPRQ